jgi:signal transduction histidine kinase
VKFPPPFRFLVPLLLLATGLIASWLDYELNLANDLERNLSDVTAQAEATGTRLAAIAQKHLARGEMEALHDSLSAWKNEPWLQMAAVADNTGVIMASSEPAWVGRSALESPVAPAWARARQLGDKILEAAATKSDFIVSGAFPLAPESQGTRWLLEVFDRADAVAEAKEDARRQLAWGASVIAFLCFCLWSVLHFGVAARLGRLARSAREFGEGRETQIETLGGSDEVHELSQSFAEMGERLAERGREQLRLERELVDAAERERQRIGHELHDGVGQQLTAALMATNGLQDELQSTAPVLAAKVDLLGQQLRDAIASVRGLSHGLAPVPLWQSGLEHALEALAEVTQRISSVRCVFECPQPVEVRDEAAAANLYRITQEAVNNALKHASPSEIRIGLERRGDTIVLEIDDDGTGLPERMPEDSGMGLRVMRHRVEMLGGLIEQGAPPAGGTRIAVHIACPP